MIFMFFFLVFFSYLFFYNLVIIFNMNLFFFGFSLMLSFMNNMFCFFLLIILFFVLFFSFFYMKNYIFYYFFLLLIFLFVMSMVGLVFSVFYMNLILFWDYLGLFSFFLVLFYNNFNSLNSALVTVLSNRLGDFFIFLFFNVVFLNSWDFNFVDLLYMMLTSLTKSAQFPFSGWLSKAMSAPTPVSALVHSSTLVTAGLFLVFVFVDMVFSLIFDLIFFVGLMTLCFSSFLGIMEKDMKKTVAWSTLSQIGFCFLSFSLGYLFLSMLHLLSHAFFKSFLFLQIGFYIYFMMGEQEFLLLKVNLKGNFWLNFQIFLSLLNLCGVFFMSGFFSKHIILSLVFSGFWSGFILFLFLLGVFLTFYYSLNLMVLFYLNLGSWEWLMKSYLSYFLSLGLYFMVLNYIFIVFSNLFFLEDFVLESEIFLIVFYLSLFVFVTSFFKFNFKVMFLGVLSKLYISFFGLFFNQSYLNCYLNNLLNLVFFVMYYLSRVMMNQVLWKVGLLWFFFLFVFFF